MCPEHDGIIPRAWLRTLLLTALIAPVAFAQADDEDREAKAVARFIGLLEKAPRRGTSLDRVYGFHVERGSLDAFVDARRAKAGAKKDDGSDWMIVGLIESQRGRDSAAVEAFRQAEAARPGDPLASFYLGQSLVLVGQTDPAAEAFERALERKPARVDAMEIYQALGRVHQRARRNDQALKVWERLEAQFPDDARVAEQIALTLAEEGQPALALARFEKLAGKARDPYRKVQFAMEAADLKVRLGKKDESLTDFEAILATLNPDSWLHKEVRRKIDEVFLRNDDQAGLAAYYEGWLKKHADDIDAITRRARILSNLGRAAEAREDLSRAVKLAPSRRDLRIALVDQFIAEKDFAEAARQYEDLAKADPNNPDNLREWGRLLLRDPAVPEADRKQAAARVWNRLLESRPRDAAVAAQVADLFRKAEMTDEALSLYRKAVELAADAPQYREYLGEYLHALKKGDEALAVWKAMAEGALRNAVNQGRLAEVLSGFGYKTEAEKAAADAVSLDPKGFEWRMKHADLLAQLDRHADALAELAEAEKLVDDADQAETVLTAEIKSLQAGNALGDRIDLLRRELESGKAANADRYRRLARYQEAAQKLPEANAAISRALELDPKSVPSYNVAARLAETSGNLGRAADVYRKLAEIDRRARTEHFTAVARLEARLGRRDEALKAGRELLAAAPNNPEHYQTFAELCFGLGENDEALKALRRASQLNDTDPRAALALAEALSNQFRTDEAIEVYWRAFDKSTELDPKIGVIAKLVPLYLQQNQFERLTARIERAFQERDAQQQSREKAACLAQAYAGAGDLPAARQQLESLLAVNPRDTQLLGQLEGLAESEGDFASAARYQKQILDVAPGFENSSKLAQLYLKSGEFTEAENLWASLAGEEAESHRVLQAIDNLLVAGKFDIVESVTAKLIGREPTNWDALYREGFALASRDQFAEALRRFEAILALTNDDNQLAAIERARQKSSGGRPAGATASAMSPANSIYFNNLLYRRQTASTEILRMTGLNPNFGVVTGRVWTPADFGQARLASLGWALAIAQRDEKQDEFIRKMGAAVEAPGATARAARDWYYLNVVRSDGPALYRAALRLARTLPADTEAQWALLSATASRGQAGNPNLVRVPTQGPAAQVDRTPPLPDDELRSILDAFEMVRAQEPNWLATVSSNVATELKRAKRTEEVDTIFRELADAANTAPAISSAMAMAADRADIARLLTLSDRMDRLTTGRPGASVGNSPSLAINKAMVVLFDRGDRDEALKLLDHFLDALSRPDRVAKRSRGQGQSSAANLINRGQNVMIQVSPTQTQYVNLDVPLVGSYFDLDTIGMLRNAFEMYRRGDILSDFLTHLADRKAKAQDDPIYSTLALAYAQWWNGDRDESMQSLTAVSELAPNDADLKLGVAEILAGRNEPAEALVLADSVEPADQKLMQRRELLAMRLAVLTGDVDRARRAAERLFGLRLDPGTQVQLAEQMHQLGQHELAEAVLGRARRRASNDVNALVSLMLQYQRQNQADQALQVAYQILRRSPRQNANSPYIAVNSVDGAQQQALQVLMRSGKLEEQIARIEAQIEHAPGSLGLYQTLLTYCNAAGQRDKVKKLQDKILELRPDDANLRYQLAQQAYRSQDYVGSAGHYKAAILKDPGPFGQNFFMVLQAFRMSKQEADLIELIHKLDVRTLLRANPYNLANFAEQLMSDPSTRDAGIDLFRRAFKAFPSQRIQFLANLGDDEFWSLPEVYDYLREVVIPQPAVGSPGPWEILAQNGGYSGDGRTQSIVSRLLDLAARQGRLEALDEEVGTAIDRWPTWSAGKVVRSLIRLREGRVEEARSQIQALIDNKEDPLPQTGTIATVLGQELEADPATQGLAESFYRKSIEDPSGDAWINGYDYSPARRLVDLYRRTGRLEEARGLLLSPKILENGRANYDPNYAAYLKVNSALQGGQALIQLGFPADAVRLYRAVQLDTATLQSASQFFGSADQVTAQLRNATDNAIRSLQGEALARAVQTLAGADPGTARAAGRVDHIILIQPRAFPQGTIVSLLDEALRAAAKQGQTTELSAARNELIAVGRQAPDDLSAQAAVAMVALHGGDRATAESALQALKAIVEKTPLEPLKPNARANQRQRQEAERWLALWPVVRHCAQDASLASLREILADRAAEAARRQTDPLWLQALLRERGQMALDRGDRAAAEKLWGELLDTILADPSRKARDGAMTAPAWASSIALTRSPAGISVAAAPPAAVTTPTVVAMPAIPLVAAAPMTATTSSVASPTIVVGTPVAISLQGPSGRLGTTTDRFSAAAALAKLAAEKGMVDLSLRALRDGLKGGPPVLPVNLDANQNRALVLRLQNGLIGEAASQGRAAGRTPTGRFSIAPGPGRRPLQPTSMQRYERSSCPARDLANCSYIPGPWPNPRRTLEARGRRWSDGPSEPRRPTT
ncbi:MAG: tetratricopeptide repeat protein [Isosphaeraceae bacterium]